MIKRVESALETVFFASRWLQAWFYLGLVVALGLYGWQFTRDVFELFETVSHGAPRGASEHEIEVAKEAVLIGILGLVDFTMVANLVVMVIIGGYTLFVSQIKLEEHEDHPEWLEKTNAASLKIKLAASLVGVSGIHLLKTFINIEGRETSHVMWQVIIHTVFLFSTLLLSIAERVAHPPGEHH